MKTKKQRVISIVIMAALVCAVLTGCEEDPDSVDWEKTVTLAHGVGSITVKGNMTAAQWSGVPDKIGGRINDRLNGDIGQDPDTWLAGYIELFGRGVVYIVEPNPVGYTSYKITGDGKTVYIALDKVDTTVPGNMLLGLYQNKESVDGVAVSKAGKAIAGAVIAQLPQSKAAIQQCAAECIVPSV